MISTFFTISASDTSAMISYGSSLVSDFMPVLVIVIGIGIAIWIIRAVSK